MSVRTVKGTGAQARVPFLALDEWTNALTGLGQMLRDSKTSARAAYRGLLTQQECEEIYAVDKLHRRIADKLPDDATRRWLELDIPKAEDPLIKKIEEEQDRLQVRQNIRKAWSWARIHGGAAIFINTGEDDKNLREPLDLGRINSIVNLLVLSRWELQNATSSVEMDISKPNFGNPNIYELRPTMSSRTNIPIHYTRLIRFDGEELPEQLRRQNNYWHDSVFTGVYTALRNYGVGVSAAASMLSEFRQVYYYIKNLANHLAAGQKAALQKRIEAQSLARSVLGTFLLDLDEEKIESTSITLAGFADTLDRVKLALQASTDMPHTILFNESPSGLGATGRSEEKIWYDNVHSQQETYLAPRIDRAFEVIFSAKRGPTQGRIPENWTYDFIPLWEPDDKEKADTEKIQAETDQIYMDGGVLENTEVRENRFPDLPQLPKEKMPPAALPAAGGGQPVNPKQPLPPAAPAPDRGAKGQPEA